MTVHSELIDLVGDDAATSLVHQPRTSAPSQDSFSSAAVGSLRQQVEMLIDPLDAADEVTAHLYENFKFLPSVYIERSGVLRFLAGRGQWQVLDGIREGVGLTGAAFAAGEAVLVQDVHADPRYREAVPGVVAELAVPLTIERRIVGVLNVDAPAYIDDEQVRTVKAAARLLEQAFTRTGLRSNRGSPPTELGRHAPRIARTRTVRELARAAVTAGVDVAQLQSAVLWTDVGGILVAQGLAGSRAAGLAELETAAVNGLAGLVSHVSSLYSTGPVIRRTFGPMGLVRDRGFDTVFVAALRDRGRQTGLLVVADPDAEILTPEAVQALELLGVLAGVTLARIQG